VRFIHHANGCGDAVAPVLGGSLSHTRAWPEQLKIKTLIRTLEGGGVEEIIIATKSHREGEATAVYMSKLLKPLGVRAPAIGVGILSARTSSMPTKSPC